MSYMKNILLTALAEGEPVPGWPPAAAIAPTQPVASRRAEHPWQHIRASGPRRHWPHAVWMRLYLDTLDRHFRRRRPTYPIIRRRRYQSGLIVIGRIWR